ncbi:agmatine deiminase [Chloropicon primus]|uniref:Agmatine deiminase n=2 Tax=Chloropicon primus TaxID=1764295 RepID=A0A5B8MQ15_9CHLO|nr:agmatine deiminase [Chloropicon primus]UPR01831.1 agmatine deiminase [Chloropicon primus]|eukprot:QDZ22609.1 agmatine deiminase [Chloropicon primus]
MPAEWEEHECCWLGWPERRDVWPNQAREAKLAVARVCKAIVEEGREDVRLIVSERCLEEARAAMVREGLLDRGVEILQLESNDVWLRDIGPTFVHNEEEKEASVSGISWRFNGWGLKFPPWDKDDEVAGRIVSSLEGVPLVDCQDFVLEGGSFHSDGAGTVLTTESCLLHKNRNPGLSRGEIEAKLFEYLGARKVVWLPSGLVWDEDTDGHVDNFACFGREGLVLLAWCECGGKSGACEQCVACSAALEVLTTERDAKGRKLEVLKVPLPETQRYTEEEAQSIEGGTRTAGERLACSYLNFYIANEAIILPGFGASADSQAKEIIERVFPERKCVQLPAVGRQLSLGGGNIHCITQQQPKPKMGRST